MEKVVKSEIIKNYIKNYNLTIKQFCEQCKISEATLSKLLKGEPDYKISTLHKVCKIIECKIWELINEEESYKYYLRLKLEKNKKPL